MKIAILISRILVGSVFIISGLIKVNDAIGFSYKLLEYFSFKALNFTSLEPYALEFSVFIAVGEVLLGIAALLGAWPKFTSTMLFALCVFFGWLTYYTATCEPNSLRIFTDEITGQYYIDSPDCVTECGCFGDAIKFTPWESFTKDMILLVLIIPFLIGAWMNRQKLNTGREDFVVALSAIVFTAVFCTIMLGWYFPVIFVAMAMVLGILVKSITSQRVWTMALASLLLSAGVQYWTLTHLPLKDFRPYAIGQNIRENMKTAEELGVDPPKKVNVYTMRNLNTGEIKEMDSDTYLQQNVWKDKTWEIVKGKTKSVTIKEGYEPKILDFSILDADGNDIRDEVLDAEKIFLLIVWNLKQDEKGIFDGTETANMDRIREFASQAEANGIPFYAVTTSDYNTIEDFRHEHQLAFPFMQGDMKVLQTMMRANPGLVYLEKATVVNMWSHHDIPSYSESSGNGFKP